MPMMPFIGVRISWLVIARKRDFAMFEASALSRASSSAVAAVASAARRRLVPRRQTKRPSAIPTDMMRPATASPRTSVVGPAEKAMATLRPLSSSTKAVAAMIAP